jgi:hypothetical protein
VKFVLHDRDASFTAVFDAVFQAVGVRVIRSAVRPWRRFRRGSSKLGNLCTASGAKDFDV